MTTAAEHLGELLRIPTVSRAEGRDEGAFAAFRAALERLYPRTFGALEVEEVAARALLLTWRGGPGRPVVLMAHGDVVPVDGQAWSRNPFGGAIEGGAVHGRGALDDKGALVAVLEAVESLLGDGTAPSGDVLVSIGLDEEVGGAGARAVAALLAERGIDPELVLDEGGAVVTGMVPGVRGPLALVGLTEKSVARVRLVASATAGHASAPARGSATARLARALLRIERRPAPARTNPALTAMVAALGPRLPRPLAALPPARTAALLAPVLGRAGGLPAALVRTTVAVTGLAAGTAANVLPGTAEARLNVRIAPGDSVEQVLRRLRRVVRDRAVAVELDDGADPAPPSPAEGEGWDRLTRALAVSHPRATAVPYLMVQASDARFFAERWRPVYRFAPFAIDRDELASIHGTDERLRVDALEAGVAFFRALLTG
ncbi:M20/M25/M40 family metallo-hydrolase [Amnibacterium sp. CER49]|uniref:M20/M25/M40 family metallo-hydrolase n=1 Tax=Amnibacterium sp. CER49 TaxID=3039161 RepID=UPI0024479112|nr:M20/M25/M40 family metallo-hydrolase [Amnibacterium sp. CER49]MDH2443879.1 M20/M25/M40 family metallo-hydrolase [Amnibacterium sp. CER49]